MPLFAVVAILVINHTAKSAWRGTFSLRDSMLQATAIVVIEPVSPDSDDAAFKVVQVISGTEIKVGDILSGKSDLNSSRLAWFRMTDADRALVQQSAKVLLFLRRVSTSSEFRDGWVVNFHFEPLWYGSSEASQSHEAKMQLEAKTQGDLGLALGGIRVLTRDGQVLRPGILGYTTGRTLLPVRDANWEQLLASIVADTTALERLKTIKGIQKPDQRSTAMLRWARDHDVLLMDGPWAEFTEALSQPAPQDGLGLPKRGGWNGLGHQVFAWILGARVPSDCWQAIKLYQEVPPRPGSSDPKLPRNRTPFSSPEGRRFLLAMASDAKKSIADRILALDYMCFNVWPEDPEINIKAPTAQEQTWLIDQLVPLLRSPAAELRARSAHAISRLSVPDWKPGRSRTQRALPALLEAYLQETRGAARDALAGAIEWLTLPD